MPSNESERAVSAALTELGGGANIQKNHGNHRNSKNMYLERRLKDQIGIKTIKCLEDYKPANKWLKGPQRIIARFVI